MKIWFHSWRAAVRIARRDAWRSKGRSLLVLSMIALPILGVSAADLTLRSAELSTEETVQRTLGAADARLSDPRTGGAPIDQSPGGEEAVVTGDSDGGQATESAADLRAAFPTGGIALEDSTGYGKVRTAHGLLDAELREIRADDPMAAGIMTLISGRYPRQIGEVAATTHFLDSSGLRVGSKLTARGLKREYAIVGSYELPDSLKSDQVNALPGALLDPLDTALTADGLPAIEKTTSYLLSVDGNFTWDMVKDANAKGVLVVSRAVQLDPPAAADVPLYQPNGLPIGYDSAGAQSAALTVGGTIVSLAVAEICLLAGPAFAVGAHRARRQLGLVGANGGDDHHIRAIVLAGGLVIGFLAAVVGIVLGLALTFALQPLLEEQIGARFGGFDIRPLELLGIGLFAVLTGLLAACMPAVTASRQSVLASLKGRRGVRRSGRRLQVVGLIAVLLGVAIALSGQPAMVAGGSVLAELGVVALTPVLVGAFGRISRWLPLSPRLALRDAVRNQGRTAPAVAAVLAAVAGTVAVATYAASQDAQGAAEYEARLPDGGVSLVLDEPGGRDVPRVRAAVQKYLPVDLRADVDRISVGKKQCTKSSSGSPGCGRYEVVVPKANQCPMWSYGAADGDPAAKFTMAQRRAFAADWRCKENNGSNVVVGDVTLLKVLSIEDDGAEKALADGKVVSFDKRNMDKNGTIGIRLITDRDAAGQAVEDNKEAPGSVKTFRAYQTPEGVTSYGISMIVPPAAAMAASVTTVPYGAYYTTEQAPTAEQRQNLNSELGTSDAGMTLYIEEGYISESSIVLLALTVFAGLITIGAAGIATGLAQADAEADLKTLVAVGAPPRVRRTLSGFQCGVVAAMGVVLGSAAGVLPAIGLRLTQEREQMKWYQQALDSGRGGFGDRPDMAVVLPWETLAALLVVIPVGAAVLAALVTRSHDVLTRRHAS